MLLRSLPVLHAFFAVQILRILTSPKKLNRHSRLYAGPPLLSNPMLFFNSVSKRNVIASASARNDL